jgi:hypothetical protein
VQEILTESAAKVGEAWEQTEDKVRTLTRRCKPALAAPNTATPAPAAGSGQSRLQRWQQRNRQASWHSVSGTALSMVLLAHISELTPS